MLMLIILAILTILTLVIQVYMHHFIETNKIATKSVLIRLGIKRIILFIAFALFARGTENIRICLPPQLLLALGVIRRLR